MSRRTFVPLAIAAMMTVAAIPMIVSPANAQTADPVPAAQSINWVPQISMVQSLYANYADVAANPTPGVTGPQQNQPDCTGTTAGGSAASPAPGKLGPSPKPRSVADPRIECQYAATTAGVTPPAASIAEFVAPKLTRGFNLTANDSIELFFNGTVPTGLTMTIIVLRNGANINSAVQPIDAGNNAAVTSFRTKIPLPLTPRPYELRTGDVLSLRIYATVNGNTPVLPGTGSSPQWSLSDAGTHLAFRSSDSLRAATWTADAQGNVRSLFQPFPDKNNTPPEGIPRIVGFFAVQSAFGLPDASGLGTVPQFTLVTGNQAVPVGPNGDGVIPAQLNTSASSSIDGIAVYNFKPGYLDYRGLAPGEYNLTVNAPYYQGGAIIYGTSAKVLLTAQSVTLKPYDDTDPATFPSPLESTAHTIGPASTTTYLLSLTNTGSANDTFRIDATPVSGAGWSVQVAGPQVLDRNVILAPSESKLVTVTVGSPVGAANGAASIFQVVAVSSVDPNARSAPIILTSTVTNDVRRDVGIIIPASTIPVMPGKEQRIPVYLWNRGTRVENLSLEIRETPAIGWTVALAQGDQSVNRLVMSSVPAGSIAGVDLRVTGPQDQPQVTHDIILNATDIDSGAVAVDVPLHFLLQSASGVHVQVLNAIGTADHTVMVTGNIGAPGGGVPCSGGNVPEGCGNDDGVNGALWRVWVTNSGRRVDTFDLTLDDVKIAEGTRTTCIEKVFQPPFKFGFLFRDATGRINDPTDRWNFVLSPNATGEIYVYRTVNRNENPMDAIDKSCPADTFSFTISAKGRETGVVDRYATMIRAVLSGGNAQNQGVAGQEVNAALIEAAARKPGYSASAPFVDISQVARPQLTGGVEVNNSITYYVRVTDGSNYAKYTAGNPPRDFDPTIHVGINGVNRIGGWNVSMRPVNGILDPILNPYTDQVNVSNDYGGNGVTAFTDREIEVVVTAPNGKNGTGLAGESDEFNIQASIGSGTTSTLEVKTTIINFANITLQADQKHIFAHPGEVGAYLLYVNNSGSSPAAVTLHAGILPSTQNAPAWSVEPTSTTFPLAAFKNTTIALSVKPPFGASPGTTGDLNVTIEYAPNPFALTATTNQTLDLVTEVATKGALSLVANQTVATIGPGGFANFSLSLQNTGSQPLDFDLTGTAIGNWTQTISPAQGTIQAGETKAVVYVLKAPDDVVNDTRFSSIVRVVQHDRPDVFDVKTVNINILGGKAIPSLSVPKSQRTVDRAGATNFEVNVKNLGTATGKIDLSVRSADTAWTASIQDQSGKNITSLTLDPNELRTVNVTIRAPFLVAEHTLVPVEVLATSNSQTAKTTLQALVHDYGVHIDMTPSRLDAIAGLPTEWAVKIRNDGNDNDTLNVSADLTDIIGWRVDLATQELRLEPGQVGEVKVIVRSPTAPLPTPRAYTLKFYVGTRGGQSVNLSKNESIASIVNILNYRAIDVDHDDLLELAVDVDKNPANGYEKFYEIFPDGVQSAVVATSKINGKTNFFLDVPREGKSYDGIADVWFEPESIYAFDIKIAADVNNDNSPEYFLDTDRDGKMDKAFDAVSGQYWQVIEIKAFGDERIQYLVDTTGDGRPDRFYDPATKLATRTLNVGDNNLVGLDTKNTGKVDKVYDIRANTISDAKVFGFVDFAKQYWYFFVAFAALVVLTVVLVSKRRNQE